MVGMEGQSLPLLPKLDPRCPGPQVPVLTAHAQGCSPMRAHGNNGMPCQWAGTPLQAWLPAVLSRGGLIGRESPGAWAKQQAGGGEGGSCPLQQGCSGWAPCL